MVPVEKPQQRALPWQYSHIFIAQHRCITHTDTERSEQPVSSLTTPLPQHIDTCTIWRHQTVQTAQDSYIPMLKTSEAAASTDSHYLTFVSCL